MAIRKMVDTQECLSSVTSIFGGLDEVGPGTGCLYRVAHSKLIFASPQSGQCGMLDVSLSSRYARTLCSPTK